MPLGLSPGGTARERTGAEPALPADLRAAAARDELGDETLYLAWEIARCAPGIDAPDRRALTLLAWAALCAIERGSTRLDPAGEWLARLGATDGDRARVRRILDGGVPGAGVVVGAPGDVRPLIIDGAHVYTQRMLALEQRLASTLAARIARGGGGGDGAIDAALDAVVASGVPALSDEQRRAVRAALIWPLSVIAGGPGTGKTSIAVALVRALARLGVPADSIALAAPTGKAARRLQDSIERGLASVAAPDERDARLAAAPPRARTLHRLLGWSPSRETFLHHENHRLPARVVIVDEGSMIDVTLMDRLARAVRDDARLVLLGDADQLPSVEAGAVFRDLASDAPHAARLSRSFRVDEGAAGGRAIAEAARRINAGDGDGLCASITRRDADAPLPDGGVELRPGDRAARDALLDRWFDARVAATPDHLARKVYRLGATGFSAEDAADLRALCDHLDRFRVLCPARAAADAASRGLHRRVLQRARERDETLHDPAFFPGEPVIVLHNDYARDLMNGDAGAIVRVAEGAGDRHRFAAVFPQAGGFSAFPLDALRGEIALGHAMTVHKAQGSEFDHVALLLPDADSPLLVREVLYTAVTRARRSVTIAGDDAALRAAAGARIERSCGVAERMARAG